MLKILRPCPTFSTQRSFIKQNHSRTIFPHFIPAFGSVHADFTANHLDEGAAGIRRKVIPIAVYGYLRILLHSVYP